MTVRPLHRRNLFLMAGLSTAMMLTACSGQAAQGQDPTGQEYRTVTDIEGAEIQVPVEPQKIVTLSEPTLDAVLALGLLPVGTVAGRGQSGVPHYLSEKAQEVPLLGSVSELNYEAIGALKPDLILADGTSINNRPDVLEILRAIAPLVFCGYAGGPWQTNFDVVANAVNQADAGRAFKESYSQLTEQVRNELRQEYSGKTFSIVRWQGSGPSLILKELPAGQVLTDVGLARPEAQDRLGRGHSEPVSLENIASIDADYMFLGTLGGASHDNPQSETGADLEGAEAALEKAKATSGFTDLKAYKEDHIILVDGSLWTSTGGPLLMQGIVADIQKALL